MKTLVTGAVTALILGLALPTIGAADGAHGKRGHGAYGHHGGGHGGMRHRRGKGHMKIRLMEAMERFDLDKDGSITQDEVNKFRADRLNKFDTDDDGALTLQEYEALWMDAMKRRMVRQFQGHDADGDGKVTTEEFGERTKYMVLRRDRNGDGVLNQDDLRRMGRHGKRGRHGPREEKSE